MTDDRRQSVVSAFFYNQKTHTVMGRSGRSWATILLFYTIYYCFLALLFMFSIMIMEAISLPTSANKRAAPIQSRVDQPGLTVFPQQISRDDHDGMRYPICTLDDNVEFRQTQYYQDLKNFFESYYFADGNGFRPNLAKTNVNIVSADMNMFLKNENGEFDSTAWENQVEKHWNQGSLVIFLSLNKVLHWELKPRANLNGLNPEFQHTVNFQRDSLYFNCFQWSLSQGAISELNEYSIEFAGEGNIHASDLNKQNNEAGAEPTEILKNYVKPFVPFVIQPRQDSNNTMPFVYSNDNFRCYPVAANLNYPGESQAAWEQLQKNGLGFIDFGFDRLGENACKKFAGN